MPAIELPSDPTLLWSPIPAPFPENPTHLQTASAVKPYTAFYNALPHVNAPNGVLLNCCFPCGLVRFDNPVGSRAKFLLAKIGRI